MNASDCQMERPVESLVDRPSDDPQAAASARPQVLICVVGTADVLRARAADLAPLAADGRVQRVDWRLDDEFGEPPPQAREQPALAQQRDLARRARVEPRRAGRPGAVGALHHDGERAALG